MPAFDWQSIVTLLAVAGAVTFLVHRALAVFRSGQKTGGACGSCGSCASGKSAANGSPAAFVSLENFTRTTEKDEKLLGIDLPKRDTP